MQDNSSPQIKVAVTLLYPYPSSLIDAIPLETYDVPQNDPQFVCHPLKTDAITRGCPYSWFNLGKTIPNGTNAFPCWNEKLYIRYRMNTYPDICDSLLKRSARGKFVLYR